MQCCPTFHQIGFVLCIDNNPGYVIDIRFDQAVIEGLYPPLIPWDWLCKGNEYQQKPPALQCKHRKRCNT